MMQVITVASRVIQQIVKDKRTLALLLIAPVFVLLLLYTIMNSASDSPAIGAIDLDESFTNALKEEAIVNEFPSEEKALQAMMDQKIDAYIYMNDKKTYIEIEGGNISRNALVLKAIHNTLANVQKDQIESMQESTKQLMNELQKLLKEQENATGKKVDINMPETALSLQEPSIHYLYNNEDTDLFDQVAPAIMGFFIFFFVFIIAGISFLRERTTGTLERTLATPLKRSSIVFGYFLGFFLFVAIQTVIVQATIVDILDVQRIGSYWLLLFLNLVIASVALSLGLLLSTFARTEFQLLQFIPIAIVPQFFFSGIFDLSGAATWVKVISNLMPLTYATDALQNIMVRGYSFQEVSKDFIVLASFAIAFILLNMVVLKRQRAA